MQKLLNSYQKASALSNAGMNNNAPPQQINTQTGIGQYDAPAGFSAALLPYLAALDDQISLKLQLNRVKSQTKDDLIGSPLRYYDQILGLFGLGFTEKRFAFDRYGRLITQQATCN